MTEDEQKLFDAYVETRRELYPMWLFLLVIGLCLVVGTVWMITIWRMLHV